MLQRSLQRGLIGLRDGSEHPVRQIVVRTGLGADADLHARELVGPQRGNDRFDAVVSAGGAAWPDTDLSDREGDVVEQDDDPLRRKLIIACSLLDGQPGGIHERLRPDEQELLPVPDGACAQRLMALLFLVRTELLFQQIEGQKAHIMPRARILCAGISQPDQHPVAGGLLEKRHDSEQDGHRVLLINTLDRVGKDRRNVDVVDLVAGALERRDGVEQGQLLDAAVGDALIGRAGQNAVRCAGVDLGRAADLGDRLGCVAQRAGRIDHIVEQQAALALDVADDVHDLALVGLFAALVYDGKPHAHLVGEGTAAGHGADVRRDDDHILMIGELIHIILDEDRISEQIVHGNVKEALDLGGVQIHRQNAVCAGGFDHVRHELRGDGVAALGLAVLTGVAEIGNHGGDTAGGRALAGVDHDEQLHQIVVDGLAGGLHQEHVAAADGLIDRDGDLAVGKGRYRAVAQRQPQLAADALGEGTVCVGAENLDILTM